MRCGAFHRVEGTLCLVRHGQAALSGSKTKAPGFAGGYLLGVNYQMFTVLRGHYVTANNNIIRVQTRFLRSVNLRSAFPCRPGTRINSVVAATRFPGMVNRGVTRLAFS